MTMVKRSKVCDLISSVLYGEVEMMRIRLKSLYGKVLELKPTSEDAGNGIQARSLVHD
jgi:hypothetical protein